ncbi:MAG: Flp pilus assembly complex ATPase component TadA [Candidatus Omnitrophica bacterium]|nr:Flp pilus assembly complex ATPase component TadA [Candidatus Omnitrophota bacterium]
MLKSAVHKAVCDALLKSSLLDEPNLQKYAAEAQRLNQKISIYLVQQGILKSTPVLKALSAHFRLDIVNLKAVNVERSVIDRVPVKFASYYRFMPLVIDGNRLTAAVAEPLDIHSQDDIRAHLGLEPRFVLASTWDIDEALKRYYGLASETIDQILTRDPQKRSVSADARSIQIEDIEKQSEDPSVTKLVNQIILEAYQKRATDIHIEPYRNRVRFRYRIDGVLLDANLPAEAKHFLLAIISRIKIMANLTITEKRLPQDGSAVVRVKDQTLDLRVSTIPTQHGESMVIRLLPTTTTLLDLEKLGFNADNAGKFRELIKRPHGVIFVTGPTGSGKTTTLYACLNEINDPARKIITIEDPIEYEMEGLTQIQINPAVDFGFATGLRSILRHDPDILMVGEVRDRETADIAIRTALTGHLVFSSLHTNDAASGVTRLVDMGVEPYLVASSVQAFVAQRLVRVICPHCKEEDTEPLAEVRRDMAASLGLASGAEIKIFRGRGCEQCNNTGYFGRTAIYEILEINEAIRSAILDKPRAEEIKRIAVRVGMRTLRQDGWQNVIAGVTTPAEVMNVTLREDLESAPVMLKSQNFIGRRERPLFVGRATSHELRSYPRLERDIKVEYRIIESDGSRPGQTASVMTRDLSAAGLSFLTEQSLLTGVMLSLRIDLEDGEAPLECLARVIRVIKDVASRQFTVAVFYHDIAPVDRQRLIHLSRDK